MVSTILNQGLLASCYFMLVRSSVFREIGLLNEDFFGGAEEVEFAVRVTRAGYTFWYTPESRIWHKIGRSFKPGYARSVYLNLSSRYIYSRLVFSKPF